MGKPHIKENDFTWVYVERVLSKGSYHKLGQQVLKENNVLLISFDKYGVIKEKSLDVDQLEEYAHHNLLEILKQEQHKLFIKGFSYVFEPVQSENLSVQCLNGHYSKYTYEKYTKDILLPLVTSR